MPPEQVDVNPYASPKSDAAKPPLRAGRRFRWRLIPTVFLYLYGIGGLLLAVELVTLPLWLMVVDRDRFVDRFVRHPFAGATFFAALLLIAVVAATGGCLLVVAARRCWRGEKGDWRVAGKLAALGFGLFLVWGLLVRLALG